MRINKINPKIKEKIVLALDTDDINEAKAIMLELKDYVGVFKVGLQFYTANGKEAFDFMQKENINFFFDVKLMDIPNTVAKASANIIRAGASFYNVHCLGGDEMMRASVESAQKVAKELGKKPPIVLGVTVLSSINNEILNTKLEIPHDTSEYALKLAKLAKESGLTGVVASVWEAKKIKEVCGPNFKVLCPGIRPEWSSKDDQKRIATPKVAIQEGADYLVIGRAVTNAENRLKAMQDIYKEIETAISSKYLAPSPIDTTLKARLLLDNGMVFEGKSFGAEGTSFGEIVFNTSISGYQEVLTDPSYSEQVIVMTYPEIGNYGINAFDCEGEKIFAKGFIVKNYCKNESHYLSSKTLAQHLKDNNIIGIEGIDTRSLTRTIRDSGAMNCVLTTEEITDDLKTQLKAYKMNKDVSLLASIKEPTKIAGNGVKMAVIDLGIKKSIVDYLKKTNCDITIFPANVTSSEILKSDFDAVLLSNGPGDPQDATIAIKTAKELIGKVKLYGICLGYQILSIVLGAKTYKLKYGHRGGNHPVINLETGKVILTSQNHGYATDVNTLPDDAIPTYKNLNDNTLEGFRCPKFNIEGVQFHPEAAPGPADANKIFDKWIEQSVRTAI